MILGIDIGGTAIKAGAVAENGRILARQTLPFDRSLSFDELIDALARICHTLESETRELAMAIGVCMPGFIDRETGMLVDGGANVPALRQGPLALALLEKTGEPVHLENDGVAATFGEQRFGAGRNFGRFALLTIGTGVGGAVSIDGNVVTGSRGEPPEIGATVLGETRSGMPQTFEKLACAAAFVERYNSLSKDKLIESVPELFARVAEDALARQTVDDIARIIAQVLSALINSLSLDACVIGGGVAAAGHALLEPIRSHLKSYVWPLLLKKTRIIGAECGNDAGLLGVASLAADTVAPK